MAMICLLWLAFYLLTKILLLGNDPFFLYSPFGLGLLQLLVLEFALIELRIVLLAVNILPELRKNFYA